MWQRFCEGGRNDYILNAGKANVLEQEWADAILTIQTDVFEILHLTVWLNLMRRAMEHANIMSADFSPVMQL